MDEHGLMRKAVCDLVDIITQAEALEYRIALIQHHNCSITCLLVHWITINLEAQIHQRSTQLKVLWLCGHVCHDVLSLREMESISCILFDLSHGYLVLLMEYHWRHYKWVHWDWVLSFVHEVKVTCQLKLNFWLTQLFMLLNIIVQIDGLAIFDKNFTKLSLAHGEDIVK